MNDVMVCKGGRDTPPIECINSYSKKWALRVCFEELEDNVVKYYEKQINSDVEPSEEDRLSFEREVLRSCFNKCYTSGFEFKETRIPISEYLNNHLHPYTNNVAHTSLLRLLFHLTLTETAFHYNSCCSCHLTNKL